MKKVRWAVDGGSWELDLSTPVTVDGVARPVPADGEPLPLGLSRGQRLARPKQVDFFQRFMFMPFVPSFSNGNGLSLQRVLSLSTDTWFATLLGDFNVQKFVTSLRKSRQEPHSSSSLSSSIWTNLKDRSLYALNFCSEWLLTPQDTLLLSYEARCDEEMPPRKKAILHHKFPNHNLTVEAASPELFVDRNGNYWDIPLTMAVDLASVASDSGVSCHFCVNHAAGSPKRFQDEDISTVPAGLLPELCAKCAVSYKKNFNIWRSEAPKTKMVQPYDIFLSNPHISASTVLGTVVSASLGDNSVKVQSEDVSSWFQGKGVNPSILADIFASVSLTAQHGNFQKLFFDLTRFHARLDIPSGSKFISGATRMAFDLKSSRVPSLEEVQAICPSASVSFQQQIAGPFSFRMDAGVTLDPKKDWYFNVNDPVLAVEYALQVLGSAKAVAWYSLKQREFMIELRFFET